MKKAMIALAGIVSVLMLASCQKEVEIDGDVSMEKTSYYYEMDVKFTAGGYDDNVGTVEWDTSTASNVETYEISTGYTGNGGKVRLLRTNLLKCKNSWYLNSIDDKNKVDVTGSPKDSSFTIKNGSEYTVKFTRK